MSTYRTYTFASKDNTMILKKLVVIAFKNSETMQQICFNIYVHDLRLAWLFLLLVGHFYCCKLLYKCHLCMVWYIYWVVHVYTQQQ